MSWASGGGAGRLRRVGRQVVQGLALAAVLTAGGGDAMARVAGGGARPAGVGSGPSVLSAYAGFSDLNGNGVLDCGEPVDLIATFATNNSGTPALSGSLFAPVNGSSGISFLHGSVVIDPVLTNGCMGTIVTGNGADDSDFQVDFTCPADPIDNNSWTLVVRYRATYTGATTSFSAGAVANLNGGGGTLSNVVTTAAGTACGGGGGGGGGGATTAIALSKTAAGPATPGSLLVYTLTATDQSGVGAGGLTLVETVPQHTTFSATGSSPGWSCAAAAGGGVAGGAGSTCRAQVGNLTANGSLSDFFAVRLDDILPAAPVVIANTGCIDAGTTLAACASASTPAGGTPVLHLAKSPAAGSPGTAVPGALLTYALSATNTGNQDLGDATLIETVPANTSFAPAGSGSGGGGGGGGGSAGWVCVPAAGGAGATCTLDVGPLAAQGGAVGRGFAVTVVDPLPALPAGALVTNSACLAGGAGNAGVVQSCSSVSTPIDAQAVLHASKTLRSGSGAPGGVLVYDLAVQNTGNEDAAAVVASETVPAGTAFAAGQSTAGWSCVPATGGAGASCTLGVGTVAAGATSHVAFAVTVGTPLAAGVAAIGNTGCFQMQAPVIEERVGRVAAGAAARWRGGRAAAASGGSGTGGVLPTCDTVSTPTTGRPVIGLTKTYGGPPAAAGAVLRFLLSATNSGDQDAAGVALSETVPAHTTFDAGDSAAGWVCLPASGVAGATCSLGVGTLAGAGGGGGAGGGAGGAGGSVSATFAVRVDSPLPDGVTAIANAACVAAPGLAPVCGQATTPPPAGMAALAASLTYVFVKNGGGDGLARAGDVLNYTLTVEDTASTVAQGVSVRVPLDAHLTLDVGSVTSSCGVVTDGNGAAGGGGGAPTAAVSIASLARGTTCTVQLDATVGPLPAGLRLLSTQATLTAANAAPTVSSDPSAAVPLSPTTTPVGMAGPPGAAAAVPALGGWGLVMLAGGLAMSAVAALRRRLRLGQIERATAGEEATVRGAGER